MKGFLTIVVALAAALAGRALGSRPSEKAATEAVDEARVAALRDALRDLREELRARAVELEQRSTPLATAPAASPAVSDADIAAALERWQDAHPAEEAAAETGRGPARARTLLGDVDLATVPMDELVAALSGARFGGPESQEVFQKLREAGRIEEYVAAIEKLAAENPNDAGIQVALGHAYLQELFGVGGGPAAGALATKADQAFDRALAIDDQDWGARFSKAVALSNWPAFMGRGREAIENFEILRELQEGQTPRPEFAMTYLFLGNTLQANGNLEDAIEAWKAGLERFPDVEDLRRALELAQSSGDGR